MGGTGGMMELAACAREYAENGVAVLPCEPRGKVPLWSLSYRDATWDLRQVREWWKREPEANIAIWPGAGHLVVLDYDGPWAIERAVILGLPIDAKVMVLTPGHGMGRHLYFSLPGEALDIGNVSTFDRLGINVKSALGLVMAPPSVHANGKRYVWSSASIIDRDPEPVPVLVYERLVSWERRQAKKRLKRVGR